MSELTYYRLEHSEKQGCFHLENPTKNNKNTNYYFCIADNLPSNICDDFINLIHKKYGSSNILTKVVIDEFYDFHLSLIVNDNL